MDDIKRFGEEVREEIALAKTQGDYRDHQLQENERAAASRHRSKLKTFISKAEDELIKIQELQSQQLICRSSQYCRSH